MSGTTLSPAAATAVWPAPSLSGPVLALASMPEELAALCRLAQGKEGLRVDGRSLLRARLGRAELLIARIGEGQTLARRAAEALLERFAPGLILSLGVAGGLSPELGPGDLVVARRVLSEKSGAAEPDPDWLDRALHLPGVVAGTLLSAERIVHSAEGKARARAALGVEGAAVVDLEAATLAAAASAQGLPFLAVRAVSDTADEDLPMDFESCRDSSGAIRRWKVVGRALAHPGSIPGLAGLRRRVAAGSERLAAFTADLLGAAEGESS